MEKKRREGSLSLKKIFKKRKKRIQNHKSEMQPMFPFSDHGHELRGHLNT